jgi:hypothetical protein
MRIWCNRQKGGAAVLGGSAFLFVLLLSFQPVYPEDPSYREQLLLQAGEQRLASDPVWLALGHYMVSGLSAHHRSLIDDPRFFLSPAGRGSPGAELDATLMAFFETPPAEEEPSQCRFRARYSFLRERLSFDDARLPRQPCARFDEWYRLIDPGRVWMVFASAFINNPASMFGHTFLRIDAAGSQTEPLLGHAANFAAETPQDNPAVYAIKGLLGGYNGYFSVAPYYQKVSQYSDIEDRDLWEYQLNLTAAEVRRLLEHLWELRGAASDYYYLNRNCSYQLQVLLEAARPGLNLHSGFRLWTIPVSFPK